MRAALERLKTSLADVKAAGFMDKASKAELALEDAVYMVEKLVDEVETLKGAECGK